MVRRWGVATVGLVAAVALLLALLVGTGKTTAQVVQPPMPTAGNATTGTLLTSRTISGTTVYSPVPTTGSPDLSRVDNWTLADIFVTATLAESAELTVTAQVSADGSNWADADFEHVDGDGAIATVTYRRVLTSTGTEYMRVPVAGQYMRVKVEAEGEVTVVVPATLRN